MPSGIDFSAAFEQYDEDMRTYYYDVLVDLGSSPDPEDTYEEMLIQLIAAYQALLVAAGPPYDDFTAEDEYAPSSSSPFTYVEYLARIYATVPAS